MTTATAGRAPTSVQPRAIWIARATVVAVGAIALLWWLAVPREGVCWARYPAGPGCPTADREGIAALWTVIVAVACALTVVGTLTIGRTRRWVAPVGVGLVLVACLWGYRATLYATALGVGG